MRTWLRRSATLATRHPAGSRQVAVFLSPMGVSRDQRFRRNPDDLGDPLQFGSRALYRARSRVGSSARGLKELAARLHQAVDRLDHVEGIRMVVPGRRWRG